MLIKNRKDRITIKEALDHNWIAGSDPLVSSLRRKSNDAGDKLAQFLTYSQTTMSKIQESSSVGEGQSSSLLQSIMSGPGAGGPGIQRAGGFAAQIQAKQAANPNPQPSSFGGGGMFGKYKFAETKKEDE